MSDLSNPGAWMLISRSDAQAIAATLDRAIIKMKPGSLEQADAREALRLLNTGLHVTDEVPGDWKARA